MSTSRLIISLFLIHFLGAPMVSAQSFEEYKRQQQASHGLSSFCPTKQYDINYGIVYF